MVNDKVVPGLKGAKETVACEHNIAARVNSFSTPSMIKLMEQAASAAVDGLLQADQTSVGYEVNIRHIARAPVGSRVVAHAELTEVRGNKLTFNVDAFSVDRASGETKIGQGSHKRAIVSAGPD